MEINKILIVEDEAVVLDFFEEMLTKLGFIISTAKNGQEALEKTFEFLPDLILLDIKMPLLDGISVIKRLRKNRKTAKIPIIVLSARAQSKEINEAMDAGADKYFVKPLIFKDLVDEINRWKEI